MAFAKKATPKGKAPAFVGKSMPAMKAPAKGSTKASAKKGKGC